MKRPGVLWGASAGAVVGYTVAALIPHLPVLYYFPRLGEWSFANQAGEPAIRWYGWMLYSVAAALLGIAGGWFLKRRPSWTLICVIATVSLLLLSWHERDWFQK